MNPWTKPCLLMTVQRKMVHMPFGSVIAKKQMRKGFGGMVAFEVEGGAEAARKIVESTRVFMLAESLGGVESIIGQAKKVHIRAFDERAAESQPAKRATAAVECS